eukprot:TRINITY_DN731_c0_g1_i1.p1 TRINITY_DN731_c0_g1~~TRINITY_DN731_c0_g1_i1.p1  ORF type:complete len:639 (+),score=180.96 TRINITY_DN731_c0_g1_i1:38-1954(+)
MAAGAITPSSRPTVGSETQKLEDTDGNSKHEEEVKEAPRDPGVPRMTPETLSKCCQESRGYELPELNEVLILHYKGFRQIEGLGAYTNVRSLFLECNGIRKIENLEAMPLLTSLYLQSNCIQRIENLEGLVHLQYLNLDQNNISKVENLESLSQLETLKLRGNKLADVAALAGLAERPSLKSVDVSCNYIEEGDALINFWPDHLPNVECLYFHHNPCSRTLKDLRRRLISSLRHLRWIDERPVTASERVGCEAWATGGRDAELTAKQAHWRKEKEEKETSLNNHRRMQEAHAERVRAMQEVQAARDALRAEATAEMEATGVLAEGWVSLPARPALPSSTAPAAAEPAEATAGSLDRQAELRAKVDALLASRRRSAPKNDTPATSEQPQQNLAPEGADAEASMEEVREEKEEAAEAAPEKEEEAPGDSSRASETPEPTPFEWSNFRDRRLGRLVADFRYNFGKAAAALSVEFECEVSSEECRARYGALCRPSKFKGNKEASAAAVKDASGRAKDGPPPDAAAVQEVSKWFVRRVARGPTEGEWHPTPSSQDSQSHSSQREGAADMDEEMQVRKSVPLPATSVSSESLGFASASKSGLFAPPPRTAETIPEVEEIAPAALAPVQAPNKAGQDASSLFDLD